MYHLWQLVEYENQRHEYEMMSKVKIRKIIAEKQDVMRQFNDRKVMPIFTAARSRYECNSGSFCS